MKRRCQLSLVSHLRRRVPRFRCADSFLRYVINVLKRRNASVRQWLRSGPSTYFSLSSRQTRAISYSENKARAHVIAAPEKWRQFLVGGAAMSYCGAAMRHAATAHGCQYILSINPKRPPYFWCPNPTRFHSGWRTKGTKYIFFIGKLFRLLRLDTTCWRCGPRMGRGDLYYTYLGAGGSRVPPR